MSTIRYTPLALAALALIAGVAQAQTAAKGGELTTITVTAERRVENIREVPQAVSALTSDVLEVLGTSGQDVRSLAARVPSLNIESSFGRAFPRFYIRGYGNTDFRLNASQPVSLVYDDVVQENAILKGFPMFDMASVEVLRGPQGTLFGRNTPAGVVKFESVKPTNKFEGYGSLSFGTFDTINAEAALNTPISKDLAARVSVLNQTRANWVSNTFPGAVTPAMEGYRDSAMRTQLQYAPSKDLSVLGNVHARDYRGSARLFRANIIQKGTNDFVPGFDEKKIATDGKNESQLQSYGGNLRVRVGLGDMALYSVTGVETVKTYSRGDIDGGFGASFAPPSGPGFIPFPSETAGGIGQHLQFTQEVRLESAKAGPLQWQGGLFFFDESYKFDNHGYDGKGGPNPTLFQRSQQKNTAWAAFGNVNYAITPALKVRGGLRYTSDKKDFKVLSYNTGTTTLADFAKTNTIAAAPSDSKVNWDLSASYALDKNVNVYARVATGYRGTSIQGAGQFNNQSIAKPENVISYEAGVKADVLNRRGRVAFNVFSYEVKDIQLTAVGGASNSNILLNATKATGQGFELDTQALLTDNLVATLSIGYNDTQIKDPNLAVAICAQCTVKNPTKLIGTGTYALINGNPLPQAPKENIAFTLRYTQPLAGGDLYVYTDWVYRSKINFFLYDSVEFTGKALTEGGLRVGYTWGNGKYDVAAFGRNITNQVRIVGGIDFNNLTGFINEPRQWGVQFKASF